jgi:uracil-DNA glycosylase
MLNNLKNKDFHPILLFRSIALAVIKQERANGKHILPNDEQILSVERYYNPYNTRIIIIGEDPYPNASHATGFAFHTENQKQIPSSLKNIFKELKNDLGFDIPKTGSLLKWITQGVMLLNICLTVEKGKSGSHFNNKCWELYTHFYVQKIIDFHIDGIVIICWGNKAQKFVKKLNKHKNVKIIAGGHPSSRNRSNNFFFGNYFSSANKFLLEKYGYEINWDLNAYTNR